MLAGGASSLTRISPAAARKKCEAEGGAPVTGGKKNLIQVRHVIVHR
jgi:hypothetical protein